MHILIMCALYHAGTSIKFIINDVSSVILSSCTCSLGNYVVVQCQVVVTMY